MSTRALWLVANWKMNGAAATVADYAQAVDEAATTAAEGVTCVFCPPTIYIGHAGKPKRLKLGAQNCHSEKSGAFTGEVSAGMLKDAGCEYVIVGHSERRAEGENDLQVLFKAQAAIAAGLKPIICVGESQADYDANHTTKALGVQLSPLVKLPAGSYLVAYEPVWAIGSGKTPSVLEIGAAHAYIKSVLGSATPVLYGGSVNAGNAREILALSEVSGALVGSASLAVSGMKEIINAARG